MEKREFLYNTSGDVIKTAIMENNMEMPQKIKPRTTTWSSSSTPDSTSKGNEIHLWKTYIYSCDYCSTIHNILEMKTMCLSFDVYRKTMCGTTPWSNRLRLHLHRQHSIQVPVQVPGAPYPMQLLLMCLREQQRMGQKLEPLHPHRKHGRSNRLLALKQLNSHHCGPLTMNQQMEELLCLSFSVNLSNKNNFFK